MTTPSPFVSRLVPSQSWPHLLSSAYSPGPGQIPTGTDTITLTGNTLYIFPFFAPQAVCITDAGFVLTAGVAASTGRIALFEWDQVNKEVSSLNTDIGSALDTEAADQGLVAWTSQTITIEPGWYAWGLVDSGAVTIRSSKCVDPMLAGNLDVSTTTLVGVNYYTATGTGMVAGGITDPGAYAQLTEVTSATDYSAYQPVNCRFSINPAV